MHWYGPRGSALDVFRCKRPEVLLSGPAGTGKSRACLEKIHALALKYPGTRFLLVRKTMVSLGASGLVTWRRFVVPEAERAGLVKWFGGSQQEPASYRYSNGSAVVVGGMNDPNKIMSTEYDVIYVQEAIELSVTDWENLTTRLRNDVMPYQQIIADTNPAEPTHWLKQRCDAGACLLIYCRHEDNPTLFDQAGALTAGGRAYMAKLDALTGVRKLRLRDGLWVAAEGQVYEGWNPALHLVDSFVIPTAWQRIWAVDFGFTNPFVCQWWAADPDGRLFLYREWYKTQMLVEDHARMILRQVRELRPDRPDPQMPDDWGPWCEPRPSVVLADHDAEGRATLEKYTGLGTKAAHKTVLDGIEAVQARLMPAGDGRPRLFVFRDACIQRDQSLIDALKPASTEDEFPGYVWVPPKDGKPVPEEPLKINDHGMDTARYVVAERDLAPRGGIRGWF